MWAGFADAEDARRGSSFDPAVREDATIPSCGRGFLRDRATSGVIIRPIIGDARFFLPSILTVFRDGIPVFPAIAERVTVFITNVIGDGDSCAATAGASASKNGAVAGE